MFHLVKERLADEPCGVIGNKREDTRKIGHKNKRKQDEEQNKKKEDTRRRGHKKKKKQEEKDKKEEKTRKTKKRT